jgi:LPS-assembly protein
VGVSVGPRRLRLSTEYLQLADNPRDGLAHLQELSLNLTYILNQYWTLSGHTTRELAGVNVNSLFTGFGAQYQDECLTFVASINQTGVRDRDIKPGTTVLFQVVFKNLGEIDVPALKTE